MSLLLSYVLLGLSLAAPIGPVNAAQMDRGLRGGFWNAWLLGLGSMAADLVFIGVVYFGTVHFLEVPLIKTFLWLFGCFVLIYSGIDAFKGAGEQNLMRGGQTETLSKSFRTGFLISISNPLSIMFWLGLYGSVLAETARTHGTKELLLYTCAILAGIIAWDFFMALTASSFRKLLNGPLIRMISYVSAISLIGFGLYFGWQACLVLFR
ncbi:LysE family translocator [Paenibacillus soyae]|uniref:LysE family translocator n=1 Tax=Paenibacillus soyae TaxID=2969249 RepID=A0A9X2S7Z7_9BACL|nr:LysE family translocator [Paenibacillus soyae]MCR2803839.1 LysE family translocator [Paenibacillus soyae]